MQWLRHFFARKKPSIPAPLWEECVARLPFLKRLSPTDMARLKRVCELLLYRKTFTGVADFEMSDETAVMIVAQAALPVLNLTVDLYDDMAGVIVYPCAFVVPQQEMDEAGVVHEWNEPVAGEAIDAGGAVLLSWEEAQDFGSPGYNIVIHEFAHKIDMADGVANGCPPFLRRYHRDIDPAQWQRVFSSAYTDFVSRVEAQENFFPDYIDLEEQVDAASQENALPLDSYASRHPAEFFAVASEAFFVSPTGLADSYPDVYRLLVQYYRQDPMARL